MKEFSLKHLEQYWEAIPGKPELSYTFLPTEENEKINLGYVDGNRSFALENTTACPDLDRKYIQLKRVGLFITITLKDKRFYSLFNDFIVSVYNKITDSSSDNDQGILLINMFNTWVQFFESRKYGRLSDIKIQGLLGELQVLHYLLQDASPADVNKILDSWKGPYKKTQDFYLAEKNIEVKTALNGSNMVKISSEHQLDSEEAKEIELAIVLMNNEDNNGVTLNQLYGSIKKRIHALKGELNILLAGLNSLKLQENQLIDYDNLSYNFSSIKFYNAGDNNFPKIVNKNKSAEINSVRYSLKFDGLQEVLDYPITQK